MQRIDSTHIHSILSLWLIAILASSLLASCDRTTPPPSTQSTNESNQQNQQIQHSTMDKQGSQLCPSAVSLATYWDSKVPTQPDVSNVESVTCAYITGSTQLQALVTVRYPHAGQTLDIHVYDDITSPQPRELFQETGLYDGDARISASNTITTSEISLDSPGNKNQLTGTPTRDLQREFQWSATAQTLVPVVFPGLYPASTRYQAEDIQQSVNHGQDTWMLDARQVAQSFVTNSNFLNWTNSKITILKGGSKKDTEAQIKVINTGTTTANAVTLKLVRLEGHTERGIWIITKAQSSNIQLFNPALLNNGNSAHTTLNVHGRDILSSNAEEKITILNTQYTILNQDIIHPGSTGTFSVMLPYIQLLKGRATEGILLVTNINSKDGSIINILATKTLLN
jgi:hypothetical protein